MPNALQRFPRNITDNTELVHRAGTFGCRHLVFGDVLPLLACLQPISINVRDHCSRRPEEYHRWCAELRRKRRSRMNKCTYHDSTVFILQFPNSRCPKIASPSGVYHCIVWLARTWKHQSRGIEIPQARTEPTSPCLLRFRACWKSTAPGCSARREIRSSAAAGPCRSMPTQSPIEYPPGTATPRRSSARSCAGSSVDSSKDLVGHVRGLRHHVVSQVNEPRQKTCGARNVSAKPKMQRPCHQDYIYTIYISM